MLFQNDTFMPHFIEDKRTKAVLKGAIRHASEIIRISDFLISAIEIRDTRVLATLTQALEDGCSPWTLRDIIEIYNSGSKISKDFVLSKESFSPEVWAALHQFDAELSDAGEDLREGVLELLLSCILSHLEVEDHEYLTILNAERCVELFYEQSRKGINVVLMFFDSASGKLSSEAFSESGWSILENAALYASNLGYNQILPPHCFLALLNDSDGITEHLVRLQLQPGVAFTKVIQTVEETFRIADGKAITIELTGNGVDTTTVSLLRTAQKIAALYNATEIAPEHLLSALLEEMPARLASILQQSPLNINLKKMRTHLDSHLKESKTHFKHVVPNSLPAELLPSEDLTYQAHIHVLSRAVTTTGRSKGKDEKTSDPYDAITRALYKREKNHLLITGLQGVGKTTLVREIARRAAVGEIAFLKKKRFLWVDCQDVSPHESRNKLSQLLSYAYDQRDLILCLDGLGSLVRAEPRADNNLILRRALKEGNLHLIGVLSNRDFEELLSSDHELLEYFTRVNIEEPDEDTALLIIKQVCNGLENDYKLKIDERAITRALLLSANYVLSERLPAKAIKILRQACEHLNYERTQRGETRELVIASDVIQVISRMSGVPEETLSGMVKKADYEKDFAEIVIGQEEAVKAVASELRRIKAGWTDPSKPASVILFAGLTGVGKTELAKVVAQYYSSSKRLQTYTMANFTEPHSVSGIIGVPPGYVGYGQGGRLINDLNADPYCVFLLDEAEKAHPEVWKPFLNLFDEAWIVDTHGVKAYADKAIFILTTNAGSEIISQMWLSGERDMDKIVEKVKSALSRIQHERSNQPVFSPEFLARIKRIVVFRPLDQDAMEGICRKHLKKMQQAWKEKREKTLIVADSLIKYIAERSHRENQRLGNKEGGRIVAKLISELIEENIQIEQSRREEDYRTADIIELQFERFEGSKQYQRTEQSHILVEFRKKDA